MKLYYIDNKKGTKIDFNMELTCGGVSDGGYYAPTTPDGEILSDKSEYFPRGESVPDNFVEISTEMSLSEKSCKIIKKNFQNKYDIKCKLTKKNIDDLKLHVCLISRDTKYTIPKLNILIASYFSNLSEKYDNGLMLNNLKEKLKSFDLKIPAKKEKTLIFYTNGHAHWEDEIESCPFCPPS